MLGRRWAAQVFLLGAQPVEAGDGLAATQVRGDHGVDEALILTSGALRRAYRVGVVTDQSGIEHARSVSRPDGSARTDNLPSAARAASEGTASDNGPTAPSCPQPRLLSHG
jgi:hypothetical protein